MYEFCISVTKLLRQTSTSGQQTESIGLSEEVPAVRHRQLSVLRREHAMRARAVNSRSTLLHATASQQEGAFQDCRVRDRQYTQDEVVDSTLASGETRGC